MTEIFLSHEKSIKINKNPNPKKDPIIELDFVSANKRDFHINNLIVFLRYFVQKKNFYISKLLKT